MKVVYNMGLIGKIVKENTDITDEVIYANALLAIKGGAKAYLAATLASTTPEIRTFFQTNLTEDVAGHSALVALGIKKGWLNPNQTPIDALMKEFEKSNCLFDHDQ
jgi:spore coat protein CotF